MSSPSEGGLVCHQRYLHNLVRKGCFIEHHMGTDEYPTRARIETTILGNEMDSQEKHIYENGDQVCVEHKDLNTESRDS